VTAVVEIRDQCQRQVKAQVEGVGQLDGSSPFDESTMALLHMGHHWTHSRTPGRTATVSGPMQLDPQQRLVHAVRAGLLTVPAVGFATAAHASIDDCVSVVAVFLAAGLCWPAAVILLRAQRRLPALIGWLVLAQGVTHLLLEQRCGDAMPGNMGLIDHLMMGVSPTMMAMHGGSVLLTAVLFWRADAGLWAAQALVRAGTRALGAFGASIVPVGLAPAPQTPDVSTGVQRPRVLWQGQAPPRRGPPASVAA